jgi:NTP-dependent ternary system trypsin peptidase co-occuring protein
MTLAPHFNLETKRRLSWVIEKERSMADLVEVPFAGGSITFAAVGSTGPEAYGGVGAAQKAQESLEEVLDQVRGMAEVLGAKLAGLDFAAAEATFGVSFTGKGKFIVAEASASASISVKIALKGKS